MTKPLAGQTTFLDELTAYTMGDGTWKATQRPLFGPPDNDCGAVPNRAVIADALLACMTGAERIYDDDGNPRFQPKPPADPAAPPTTNGRPDAGPSTGI